MYQQCTAYECGPFALKHALAALGLFTDERRLGALAGTTTGGTDEVQLARAADRFGCEVPVVRALKEADARRVLNTHIQRGVPSLLCVDQWEHWIAVVGGDGERFTVLDSADPAVVSAIDWQRLVRRWGFRDPAGAEAGVIYDVHPVTPRVSPPASLRLSPRAAEALRQPARADLVRDWSLYARDLLTLAAGAAPGNGEPTAVALATLLDERRAWLVARASAGALWRRHAAHTELDHLRLTAHGYRLRVLREKAEPVLAGVAELLTRLVA